MLCSVELSIKSFITSGPGLGVCNQARLSPLPHTDPFFNVFANRADPDQAALDRLFMEA